LPAVLINDAGIAIALDADTSNLRASWDVILSTNITSVASVKDAFPPLLKLPEIATAVHFSSACTSLHFSERASLSTDESWCVQCQQTLSAELLCILSESS